MKKVLITSNQDKLKEFKTCIPDIEAKSGKDLKEVQGTAREVAIYKALEADVGSVVEDTILTVKGEEIVDIRWKLNSIPTATPALWTTTLAWNCGDEIKLFTGIVEGFIDKDKDVPEAFGFDGVFIVKGTGKTLYELGKKKHTKKNSARKQAALLLKAEKPAEVIKVSDIPKWTGNYQNEN